MRLGIKSNKANHTTDTQELTCKFHEALTPTCSSKHAQVDNHSREMEVTHFQSLLLHGTGIAPVEHREAASTLTHHGVPPQVVTWNKHKNMQWWCHSVDLGKYTFRLCWLICTYSTRAHSGTQFDSSEIHSATWIPICTFRVLNSGDAQSVCWVLLAL